LTTIPFTHFSLTGSVNDLMGNHVNKCSGAYSAGGWGAFAWSLAMGGAAGWRAAGSAERGLQFSHFIPNRMLQWSEFANDLGWTRLNGNYVSVGYHAVSDASAWQFLQAPLKQTLTMLPEMPWTQLWMRLPNFPLGLLGGGLLGYSQHQSGCQ
jgi:hypothetical protein